MAKLLNTFSISYQNIINFDDKNSKLPPVSNYIHTWQQTKKDMLQPTWTSTMT